MVRLADEALRDPQLFMTKKQRKANERTKRYIITHSAGPDFASRACTEYIQYRSGASRSHSGSADEPKRKVMPDGRAAQSCVIGCRITGFRSRARALKARKLPLFGEPRTRRRFSKQY